MTIKNVKFKETCDRLSVRPARGPLGVRISAPTDLSRSTKQVETTPRLNALQSVRVSQVLGVEHYDWIPRVIVGVAH